ncbi:MAG TPA: hypothetical protein VIT88_15325 [Pyrinomonadaceae bacterium]
MNTRHIFLLLILVASLSCSRSPEQRNNNSTPITAASLPDDPCAVLSAARVSEVTGLEITSANRAPSLSKIVQAQEENREPAPGTICIYETRSDVGSVSLMVPPRASRRAAQYWEARSKYFETFPGPAKHVEAMGVDAWFAAGTTIHVLADGDEYFIVNTQMVAPRSRKIVVNIAKAVLERY